MEIFWEYMYSGIGAAGWVIGFIAALGLAFMIVALIVLVILWLNEANEKHQEEVKRRENFRIDDLPTHRAARTVAPVRRTTPR